MLGSYTVCGLGKEAMLPEAKTPEEVFELMKTMNPDDFRRPTYGMDHIKPREETVSVVTEQAKRVSSGIVPVQEKKESKLKKYAVPAGIGLAVLAIGGKILLGD